MTEKVQLKRCFFYPFLVIIAFFTSEQESRIFVFSDNYLAADTLK